MCGWMRIIKLRILRHRLGLNTEFSIQRSRRVSSIVGNNPSTGRIFTPKENLRIHFYEALINSLQQGPYSLNFLSQILNSILSLILRIKLRIGSILRQILRIILRI